MAAAEAVEAVASSSRPRWLLGPFAQVRVVRQGGELLLRKRPAGRAAERLACGDDDEAPAVQHGECRACSNDRR